MLDHLLAELTVAVHFLFILFVALGGLLAAWRLKVATAHVPCVLYAGAISFFGWTCPLTPFEKRFREAADGAGYEAGFIEHYLVPIIYPGTWDPAHFVWLGVAVLVGNAAVYGWILYRRR